MPLAMEGRCSPSCSMMVAAVSLVACGATGCVLPGGAAGTGLDAAGTGLDAAGPVRGTQIGPLDNPRDEDCIVEIAWALGATPTSERHRYRFDSAVRTLWTATYVFELDAEDRVIKVSGNEPGGPQLYWTNSYDGHGRRDRLVHRDGTVVEYHNTYEGDRLTTVDLDPSGPGQGWRPQRTVFTYGDPSVSLGWSAQTVDLDRDGTIDFRQTRSFDGGRLVRFERRREMDNAAVSLWTYYHDGGRLIRGDRDQGFWDPYPDGTPDIRFTWSYDSAGNVTSFEQDGTDSLDNPHLDGKPDYRETYTPGCASLLQRFPWVAHLLRLDDVTPPFQD